VRRRQGIAWGIALVLGAAAALVARRANDVLPHAERFAELAYYPSGKYLRSAVLGHAETAADLAWLRAIQYYGEHRKSDNQFQHLGKVFSVITTLSPGFEGAYVFGVFALAQEGRDFDQAEALMAEGLDHNPTSGRLAFEAGFLYFVRPGGRDLRQAAEYFELASHLPGHPASASRFAAFCRQNSGDLAVAQALWQEVLNTTQNAYMRDAARREMARIQQAIATGRTDTARSHLLTPVVILKPAY
jgi:hypothetical protein